MAYYYHFIILLFFVSHARFSFLIVTSSLSLFYFFNIQWNLRFDLFKIKCFFHIYVSLLFIYFMHASILNSRNDYFLFWWYMHQQPQRWVQTVSRLQLVLFRGQILLILRFFVFITRLFVYIYKYIERGGWLIKLI